MGPWPNTAAGLFGKRCDQSRPQRRLYGPLCGQERRAAGFCDRCEVSIAYAISGIYPEAVQIQTFCSEHIDRKLIDQAVAKTFSFAVGDIIRDLDLRRPQFRRPLSTATSAGKTGLCLGTDG